MERKKTINIGITGASGFLGTHLSQYLTAKGYCVTPLNRGFNKIQLAECDIIINLAGASINRYWNKKNKNLILESRVETTKKISEYIKSSNKKIHLINASAIGIYSSHPQSEHTEESKNYGNDFLADVCKKWEEEALSVQNITKITIVRIGLVMSSSGGVLPKMSLPAKFGIATIMGDGKQKVSWIMLEDLLRAFLYIIEHDITGIINLTAPLPLTNRELTKKIQKMHNALFLVKIPAIFIKIVMGKSSSLILKGQHVTSKTLKEKGFTFIYNEADQATFKK